MRNILVAALLLIPATGAHAQEYGRVALSAPLPETLLGNTCTAHDIGEVRSLVCLSDNMFEKASVGVTLAPVNEMSLADLKDQMREAFHQAQIRKIESEKRIKLDHAPDAIVLEGVYNTNMGLRRTWSAYHDGVLIRAIVTILAEDADGDFRDEVIGVIFGPERFAAAPTVGGE